MADTSRKSDAKSKSKVRLRTTLSVPIVLASTSPRRRDLMSQVRLPVHMEVPTAEEKAKKGESPKAMVGRLAVEKAQSVMSQCLWKFGSALIISADTIVVAPNGKTVLGKPKNEKDALRMLKMLAGKMHTVYTGYCVLSVSRGLQPETIVRVVASKVKMRPLTLETMKSYIATGEPMDKAGSYAAQGMGMALVEEIRGSYTNVVGLPVAHLLIDLEKKFGLTLFERGI